MMIKNWILIVLITAISFWGNDALAKKCASQSKNTAAGVAEGFTDAATFGFLPNESGVHNTKALQAALEKGGTILISQTGFYKISGTVYISDNTSLVFGNGVFVQKVAENGIFSQVILNKGALTRTYNSHISIIGLNLMVNGVELWMDKIYGLRGHLGFFYVKDLKIERFRCLDLGTKQFCIQVCTFEDVLIDDITIKGTKDGIHLGKGKHFKISNAILQTADDAIALAAGDWVTGNPEFGDIEDGVIENCHDLKSDKLIGAFAKIVPSAWVDWKPGIAVRHSDAVVSNGRIYRVLANNNGKTYKSVTQPTFKDGTMELDGIFWIMHQIDTIHTAVVRNVVFRDIFISSLRVPFQLMCYDTDYAHSYYKGADIPVMSGISLENINILNNDKRSLMNISAPCDIITIRNSTLRNNSIVFTPTRDFDSYPKTNIVINNCVFKNDGNLTLIKNDCKGKDIFLMTSGNMVTGRNFLASVDAGDGKITVDSDLKGLKNK